MEKAKAYIKNELRTGSAHLPLPNDAAAPTLPAVGSRPHDAANELMPSPGSSYYAQHFYAAKSTGRASAPPEHTTPAVCFVCGGHGSYEAVRVRANPERPHEPHFPFLERHEPPQGMSAVAHNQVYVMACMLCFRSLHEQWDAYERQQKPMLQRIYHMKRVDGKGFIGADVATQSEYAAQMLGLSAEHVGQNGLTELHNAAAAPPPDAYSLSRHYDARAAAAATAAAAEQPHQQITSRNTSPDYYPLNATPTSQGHNHHNHKYLSRPQSRDLQPPSLLSRPLSEPPARLAPSLGSSFAQHKYKLGPYNHQPPPAQSPGQYQPAQYQQLQQQTATYQLLQQVAAGGAVDAHAHYKGNPYSALPNLTGSMPPLPKPPSPEDDNATVLDLRHSSAVSSSMPVSLPATSASTPRSQSAQASSVSANGPSAASTEVGILDLSMPDKNSITEVCYVCGDEQRRGSLVELSTVKPKEPRLDQSAAYFPLFNEQHPRPARSRPKDPRGMIQACRPCHDDLMHQWNAHQVCLISKLYGFKSYHRK
ncbi:px [Drosophila busckii]|uniref:Px n=1 Tax=Drosophila busckii TaxID=30019 RepID=A0A0M4EDQ4_DROBS|nr:px [Drosophila busckii]